MVFAKLYNKNQELISSINAINIPNKTKILIGATYNEDSYTLFFCNSKKTRFSSVSVNIKTKSFSINEELNITLNNEKVLEFLIEKNTITILTISKKESLFKTYILKNKDEIVHNILDF
ncbi:MAG: hypothetical protein QNK89_04590, partial [Lacinutrix sp.]|uniref:hypothetical protein n=1 Tax=Lacinutrix sp. TaxID=1937692 RepID=UPI0030A171F5